MKSNPKKPNRYQQGGQTDPPNWQEVGNIKFDSNKARPGKNGEFIVKDINSNKDFGVNRNSNGSYSFYSPKKNTYSPTVTEPGPATLLNAGKGVRRFTSEEIGSSGDRLTDFVYDNLGLVNLLGGHFLRNNAYKTMSTSGGLATVKDEKRRLYTGSTFGERATTELDLPGTYIKGTRKGLVESQYTPTSLTKFKDQPNLTLKNGLINKSGVSKKEKYYLDLAKDLEKGQVKPLNKRIDVNADLGNYTSSMGRDNKGTYLSVFDSWDFDPLEYADLGDNRFIKDIDPLAYKQAYLLDFVGNGFNLYDRHYLNEETKKFNNGGPVDPPLETARSIKPLSHNQRINKSYPNSIDASPWLDSVFDIASNFNPITKTISVGRNLSDGDYLGAALSATPFTKITKFAKTAKSALPLPARQADKLSRGIKMFEYSPFANALYDMKDNFQKGGKIKTTNRYFSGGGVDAAMAGVLGTTGTDVLKQSLGQQVMGSMSNPYLALANMGANLGATVLNNIGPDPNESSAAGTAAWQQQMDKMPERRGLKTLSNLPGIGGFANLIDAGLGLSDRKNFKVDSTVTFKNGGDMALNSNATLIQGNANKVDGNLYNMGSQKIALDHNEVVDNSMGTPFVFSDSIFNPLTGNSFAKESALYAKSKGKIEKRYSKTLPVGSPVSTEDFNTIKHSKMNTDNLRNFQELVATSLGQRNSDGSTVQDNNKYKMGGIMKYNGGGKPKKLPEYNPLTMPNPFTEATSVLSSGVLPFDASNPFATSYQDYSRQVMAQSAGNAMRSVWDKSIPNDNYDEPTDLNGVTDREGYVPTFTAPNTNVQGSSLPVTETGETNQYGKLGNTLQLASLGAGFLLNRPEKEAAQLDRTPITKQYFDPSQILSQSDRSYRSANAAIDRRSPQSMAGLQSSNYVNKLNSDASIMSDYQMKNRAATIEYENRKSNQERNNNQQRVLTNDINARNRASWFNGMQMAMQNVGNYGKALNQRDSSMQALNLFRTMYPEVYDRHIDANGNVIGAMTKTKGTI